MPMSIVTDQTDISCRKCSKYRRNYSFSPRASRAIMIRKFGGCHRLRPTFGLKRFQMAKARELPGLRPRTPALALSRLSTRALRRSSGPNHRYLRTDAAYLAYNKLGKFHAYNSRSTFSKVNIRSFEEKKVDLLLTFILVELFADTKWSNTIIYCTAILKRTSCFQ